MPRPDASPAARAIALPAGALLACVTAATLAGWTLWAEAGLPATAQAQVAAATVPLDAGSGSMLVLLAGLVLALGLLVGLGFGVALGGWLGRSRLAVDGVDLLDRMQDAALQAPGGDPALPDAGLAVDDGVPAELRPLADALRALLLRQQALFEAQASQIEGWRRQAHADPLTGLPNRRHFMATLDAALADGSLPAASGLLLLRLHDLQGLNQRVGHAAADRVLQAIAAALTTYGDHVPRCAAGRLNGADFALLLPVPGLAQETAAALADALRRPLAAVDGGARLHIGAIDLPPAVDAPRALALADAALARAESGLPPQASGLADPSHPDTAAGEAVDDALQDDLAQGEQAWQRRIRRALDQGRVALADFPVRTGDGRQLHLDCPLRVQLRAGGPMEPASRWLSLAIRSRLSAAVDEKAIALALDAIRADGQARCINVAAQSLASAEFVAAIARRLEQAPEAACRLWIDLPEALALDRPLLLREVARRWRPLGVMLGLEHAGEALARIPRLIDLGLDCVRIDSRFVHGISQPDAAQARRYLQGLVQLVQAVGLQVTAEGVRDLADLEVLWALGFDAATGPAVGLAGPAGGAEPVSGSQAGAARSAADVPAETSAEALAPEHDDALSVA